jgi:hypothetical protein
MINFIINFKLNFNCGELGRFPQQREGHIELLRLIYSTLKAHLRVGILNY